MEIVFVDYSERYYTEVAGTAVPEKRSGKFVQVRKKDREYLILAPKEYALYHSDLLARFCRERGIAGSYDDERKRFAVKDPSWVVAGGGKFEIDSREKYIRLYDDSMAYGKFDSKGLKEKIRRIKGLEDYKVRIE